MSKYEPLGRYLKGLKENTVTLSFRRIEDILGFELPPYAHTSTAWINSDIKKRPQAQQWIRAGWERGKLDLERKEVSFIRVQTQIPKVSLVQAELDEQEQADEQQRNIEQDVDLTATEKKTLINARIGQGQFRQSASRIEPSCRLTGISDLNFLIASHIKPWKDCNNQERLDGENGLMLAPHIDKLFDRGWISFSDKGDLLFAPGAENVMAAWNIDAIKNVGQFRPEQCHYLAHHRSKVFLKDLVRAWEYNSWIHGSVHGK